MDALQIFNNPRFGEIRTFKELDGSVTFCAADVAKALGYIDTPKAIKLHCKSDGWAFHPVIDSMGRKQNAKFLTRGNLIRLAATSELDGADEFESWIFDEVIPQVLQTGTYSVKSRDSYTIENPIERAEAWIAEEKQRQALAAQIESDRPKVNFANSVAGSANSIIVRDLAKLIKQNGVEVGEKRLFAWLRENGFLISKFGRDYNSPTQKSMDMGLMEIKETAIDHASGYSETKRTPLVTGKGQTYFINKFCKEAGETA